MHLLVFLLLFSPLTFAQLNPGSGAIPLCNENTFQNDPPTDPGTYTYDCVDVVITNTLTSPLTNNVFNLPLTIRATGSVSIDGSILLQGTDGNGDSSGGPGGGAGGVFFFSGAPGEPTFPGPPFPEPPPQGGENPSQSASCSIGEAEGSGGGGGSLLTLGDNGKDGIYFTGDGTVELGGLGGGTLYSLDLNSFISAGAGGGSGEAGCSTGTPVDASNGGGGGGGMRIISAGDITITGTINVSGGNGGSSTTLGGGGGGGSGGIIVLQSLSKINLNSTLLALGGQGGTNSTPGDGGNGGNGAPGYIYLEDVDGIKTYTGSFTPPSPTSSKQSLNSDISCGTIAKAEESHSTSLMLMAMGFLLVLGTKILFQFPMKLSRKFVHRN